MASEYSGWLALVPRKGECNGNGSIVLQQSFHTSETMYAIKHFFCMYAEPFFTSEGILPTYLERHLHFVGSM